MVVEGKEEMKERRELVVYIVWARIRQKRQEMKGSDARMSTSFAASGERVLAVSALFHFTFIYYRSIGYR